MASKRHLRRKACENKIQYDTLSEAYHAVKSFSRRGDLSKMLPYHCKFCHRYHIGHTPGFVAKEMNV